MKALKINYAFAIILVAIACLVFSCGHQEDSSKQNPTGQQLSSDTAGKVVSAPNDPMAEEKTKMKARITELGNKIDNATAKIDKQMATADVKTRKKLTEEKADYASAKEKLKEELDKFSTDAAIKWDAAKSDISRTVDSLEKKLKLD